MCIFVLQLVLSHVLISFTFLYFHVLIPLPIRPPTLPSQCLSCPPEKQRVGLGALTSPSDPRRMCPLLFPAVLLSSLLALLRLKQHRPLTLTSSAYQRSHMPLLLSLPLSYRRLCCRLLMVWPRRLQQVFAKSRQEEERRSCGEFNQVSLAILAVLPFYLYLCIFPSGKNFSSCMGEFEHLQVRFNIQ